MRTPTIIYGLKNSQKVRIIFKGDGSENDIGLYMTIQQLVSMFATTNARSLAWEVLIQLSNMRQEAQKYNELVPSGIGTTIRGKQIQLDLV
jgi:hypothetical protein